MLHALQLTPLSVQLAWQAGSILDEYGMAEEAARFYDHALAVHKKADPHGSVPAGFLLALAQNLNARGQHGAAIDRTREAIAADPSSAAQAAMFLYYLLERVAPGTGEQVHRQLTERFAHIREAGRLSSERGRPGSMVLWHDRAAN